MDNLGITPWKSECAITDMGDILNITHFYKAHPSVIKIKDYYNVKESFSILKITEEEINKRIIKLGTKKATAENDIPAKILVNSVYLVSSHLENIFNESIEDNIFPTSLKKADVLPIHKKNERTKKENYRL